jgi:predicted dehydrogenase
MSSSFTRSNVYLLKQGPQIYARARSVRELKPVKLGIIGLGRIAVETHLPLWLKMRDKVQVVTLSDVNKKRLDTVSNLFCVGRLYEDPFEMLSAEDLDLVDVCTPPFSHKPLSLGAFNFDVNCIVEKPLVTSVDDFEELRKAAQKRNLDLFAIHNYSFVPVMRKARNLLLKGEMGDILQVDVQLSMPLDPEFEDPSFWANKLPGGLFGEIAPHPCYVLAEFLSGEIEEVKSQMVKRSTCPFLVGDELKVCVRTDKALGSFSVSFNSPTRRMVVDLLGSKSWVSIDAESQTLVKYPPITHSRAIFQRGQRSLSDIFQRTKCLAGVSLNVIAGRYKPMIEGHKYLFGEAVRALNHQGSYPVGLATVQKEVKILEDAFSQLNIPEKPCEAPSARALNKKVSILRAD